MRSLNVATIVPRTEAEGPGIRFALWVQGCPMRCAGCCNPDFLVFEDRLRMPIDEVLAQALEGENEGISLLGGEPFSQADSLADLAEAVRGAGRSVMVFSGHTLAEIQALPGEGPARLLASTDLLVDGRYDAARRTTERRWVGSENQVMHFLTDRYSPDDPVFFEPNHLEIRLRNGVVTLNGWPTLGAATRATERPIRVGTSSVRATESAGQVGASAARAGEDATHAGEGAARAGESVDLAEQP